jgi:hypothetical protein
LILGKTPYLETAPKSGGIMSSKACFDKMEARAADGFPKPWEPRPLLDRAGFGSVVSVLVPSGWPEGLYVMKSIFNYLK